MLTLKILRLGVLGVVLISLWACATTQNSGEASVKQSFQGMIGDAASVTEVSQKTNCQHRVIVTVADEEIEPPPEIRDQGLYARRYHQSGPKEWIYWLTVESCRELETVLPTMQRDSSMNAAPDSLQKIWHAPK